MIEIKVVPMQNLAQYYAIKIGNRMIGFDPDDEDSFVSSHRMSMVVAKNLGEDTVYDNTLDWAINQFGIQILDKI